MVYYDEVYGASRMDFIVSEGINTTNLCIFNKSSNKVLAYSLLTDAVTPVVPSYVLLGPPLTSEFGVGITLYCLERLLGIFPLQTGQGLATSARRTISVRASGYWTQIVLFSPTWIRKASNSFLEALFLGRHIKTYLPNLNSV